MPPGLVRVEDVPIYLLGEDVIPQEVPGEPGMIESRPGDCDAPLGQTEPVGETPVVRYAPFRAGNGAVPASHVLEPERHFPARAAVRGQEARTGDTGLRVCRRETVLVGQGFALPVVPVRGILRRTPFHRHRRSAWGNDLEYGGKGPGADAPDARGLGIVGVVRQALGGPIDGRVAQKPSELFDD